MPGMPLMPGVVMCEAAAQLCSYHAQRHQLLGTEMIGFGGLDGVRFRGTVVPGDRVVIVAQKLQLRRGAMIRCRFQCFVREQLICEGEIRGIPIPVAALGGRA
jgi:3-hydroxyacyl-[acyl-carrier-protein] dehydratase